MHSRLTQLFLELVRIDSPSGYEDMMCDFIKNYLTSLGLSPIVDSYGNIVVRVRGAGAPVLLSAHVDTVEPGRGVKPVIKSGMISSKGETILGADNKVGVAIILDILREIQEKKLSTRSLEIVFTRSEEVGNYGAVNLDYSLISAKQGYIFDNPNPVGTIITAAPFYNRFDIIITGRSIHASKPELGIHALSIAAQALRNITLGKVDKITTVNIGAIEGGHVRNTIMGELTLHGEVRSFKEENLIKATEMVTSSFSSAADSFGGKVTIEVVRENGGYQYNRKDKDILNTQKFMNKRGLTSILKEDWGCSDANIFIDYGIRTINLGDGCIATHTVDESVKVKDMQILQDIILDLILSQEE
ncbi:MAG TPA: M20/M25/M40 family metallo-hydrolase [Patescibacteria group bacterium]|nr:M20/M25/M40 family metallo-hydrolase [Patescibacteria group bacterium]